MREPEWAEEGRWPTPEEWADYFVALPKERQWQLASVVLSGMRESSSCFMMCHVDELDYYSQRVHSQQQKIELGRWLIAEARQQAAHYRALAVLSDENDQDH